MKIETQRLLIRDVRTEDGIPFAKMAADGSLIDCGFDRNCGRWITKWTAEAEGFAFRDNPDMDYLAYTIILKDGAWLLVLLDVLIMKISGKQGLPILSVRSIETMAMLPKRLKHIQNIS